MDKGEEENQPCGMQVSCGDGDSTKGTRIGNLKRHLQRWHSKEAEELEEKETAQANKKRGKFSQ
jgi:hypothetical protein